jgi:hypothetical protein
MTLSAVGINSVYSYLKPPDVYTNNLKLTACKSVKNMYNLATE